MAIVTEIATFNPFPVEDLFSGGSWTYPFSRCIREEISWFNKSFFCLLIML